MTLLTIGQVAKAANVSCDTVRLYEQYGLIDKPERAPNGYRQYPQNTIDRLKFIIRSKNMGFTLNEIHELLTVHQSSKQSCHEIKQQAQRKMKKIEDKIADLKLLEKSLRELVAECEKRNPKDFCPIFVVLEPEKKGGNRK